MRGIWKRWKDETGAELVEFALVLLPLLFVTFLILDVSWVFFAQASLQYAAGTGVRYAITSNVMKDSQGKPMGQDASIKSIVQQNAMGFLDGQSGLDNITINYYSPSAPSNILTGSGSNAGGNIVEVSIQGVQVNPLGFVWPGGPTTLSLSASSTDVMETSPGGNPPSR
jgi:Flp pilus assembly protein TadG